METLIETCKQTWDATSAWRWYILLAVALLIAYIVYRIRKYYKRKNHREQIDRVCATIPETETIFVSIASYRDNQCAPTILDLFEKAACPFRITVGVCQQNYPIDEDVMVSYHSMAETDGVHDFSSRIRVLRISADEAQGPMYARSLIERHLYRGEKYYMITDSHMMFTPNWDLECIRMLHHCLTLSPKPVLTMYPEDFKPYHRAWTPSNYDNESGSYLRFKKFNEKTGLVEIEGPRFKTKPQHPQLGLFWGACFSFGFANQIQEVPYDPNCYYVFLGEEICMSARLWTNGYDFYHPNKMVVYHMWTRERPTFWQQFDQPSELHHNRRQLERQGYERIKVILKILGDGMGRAVIKPFGLGQVRSIEDYMKFIGIDMRNQKFTTMAGLMGLPVSAQSGEILSRFGTWTNYKKILDSVNVLVRQHQN